MPGPTQRAVLDGRVHGVVVQARMYTGVSPSAKTFSEASFRITRNWTVAVVSVTSL